MKERIKRAWCYWFGHQWESYQVVKWVWSRRYWTERQRTYTNWRCLRCGVDVWWKCQAPHTLLDQLIALRWHIKTLRQKPISNDDLPF